MAAIAFSNRSMSSTALVAQRSRHRIRPFRLHRPTSADEAAAIFAASTGAAAYFGGGIDVVATLKTGVVLNDVIHLGSLPAWTAISEQDDAIAIAGGVTHQRLVDDPLLRQRYPALCAAWASVANHRIRIKGTLAGNLMAANPVYDFALAAIALGARLDYLDSGRLSAQVPAERISDIPHGALLTHIMLPRDACFAFVMQCEWKPIVSFALSFRRVEGATMARLVAGCGFRPAVWADLRLAHDLFERSARETAADIAERLCSSLPPPLSDWRSSAEYRRHLLKVLARREIERIRAGGPAP